VETIDLDKILSKFDQEKVEQISRLMDNLHSLNDALSRLDELNRSGTLDVVISSMYALKTLKDMLNDDALHGIGEMISSLVELAKTATEPEVKVKLQSLLLKVSSLYEILGRVEELQRNGALDAVMDLAYALKTLKDMLNDDALQKLSGYVSSVLEVLSALDEKSTAAAKSIIAKLSSLNRLLDRVEELQRNGALDAVMDLAYALKTLKDMLNDDALHDLADKISVAVDFVARGHEFLDYINSPIFQVLGKVVTSEELRKSIQEPSPIGLGKLISSLRDPEVQRGLGVVLALLKGIGKNVGGKESGQTP